MFVSFVGFAQPAEGRRPMERMQEMKHDFMSKLALTDQQQKDMQKLRIDLEKKQTQLTAKIRTERLDLRSAFLADNPDRAAIEKGLKSISDLHYQMKLNRLDHWYAVKAMLTPEQQKTWKQGLDKFMSEMGGRRAGMMRQGHGMMRNREGGEMGPDS